MKVLARTLFATAALAFATGTAFAQTDANAPPKPPAQAPQQKDIPPPGGGKTDTNKMGTPGPESPVGSDAPNAEACKKIKVAEERDRCLQQAREAAKAKSAKS